MSNHTGKWAGKAEAYAETFGVLCAQLVDPLLDALAPTAGARLLDVGTGTGSVARAARDRGCQVVAVDPEADMLAMAVQAIPGVEFIEDGLPGLDRVTGPFDDITANCVLNQLAEPQASVRRLTQLLSPDGRLAISTWPEAHPLQQLWNDVVAQAGAEVPSGAARSAAATGFERSLDGVSRLLAAAGVQLERVWAYEFVHRVDPQLWWSGPSRGVAWIGQVYRAQSPAKADAMERAYQRLSAAYLAADGMLHLPATAILALGGRSA